MLVRFGVFQPHLTAWFGSLRESPAQFGRDKWGQIWPHLSFITAVDYAYSSPCLRIAMPRRLTFDRTKPPHDMSVEWIDAANLGLKRLRARKVSLIVIDQEEPFPSLKTWVDGYLQAH